MSNENGLNIQIDDDLKDFIPSSDIKEIEIETGGVVLDPIKLAAVEAAEDNHNLDKIEIEKKEDVKADLKKEEKPKADPEKKKEEEKSEGEEKKSGLYVDVAKHFHDEGIFSEFDEEMEDSPEAFQKMIEKTVEDRVAKYKDSFQNETAKRFLDYIENGGDPSQFIQATSGIDYSKITEDQVSDDVDAQKQILRNYYESQGEDREETEDMIQAFEDAGQLEKRSLTALTKLQVRQEKSKQELVEQQKIQAQTRREENQKILTSLKNEIDSLEDVGGFPLTTKLKGEFYDFITKVNPKTGRTGLMEASTDPKKQMLMSFLYFNNFDFKKLEKKIETKEVRKLEETLGRYSDSASKQKSQQRTKTDKTDPGKLNLAPMRKLFG